MPDLWHCLGRSGLWKSPEVLLAPMSLGSVDRCHGRQSDESEARPMRRWLRLLRVIFWQSAPVRHGFWTAVAMLDRVEIRPRCGIELRLWIMDEASVLGGGGGTLPLDEHGEGYTSRPYFWTPAATTTAFGPP